MSATALFVYGTLRAGEGLSHLLPAQQTRYAASVAGRLHYSPHTYGYPVLLPAQVEADRVQGDLLMVDLEDPDITYVMLMEIQSGYSATWAKVDLDAGGYMHALTFTWHPADGAGPRIESGDWSDRNVGRNKHTCEGCDAIWPTVTEALDCEWSHDMADAIDAHDSTMKGTT